MTYYSVGCSAFNGVCGNGWENLRLQCMLGYTKSNSKFKIDLGYCDKKEITYLSSMKKECFIPCENYEWKTIDIKVVKINFFTKEHY